MKRKVLLMVMCILLACSTVIAPLSACASTARILKVNTNANLRDPDDVTHVLTFLKKGTKVLWMGKSKKSMYLVATTDGYTGYIFKDYLSSYGAVSSKSIYKTTTSAKLYKKPSTSASKVTTVHSNRYVLVYAAQNGWAYVKTVPLSFKKS